MYDIAYPTYSDLGGPVNIECGECGLIADMPIATASNYEAEVICPRCHKTAGYVPTYD